MLQTDIFEGFAESSFARSVQKSRRIYKITATATKR
jgi:hypothetical protein